MTSNDGVAEDSPEAREHSEELDGSQRIRLSVGSQPDVVCSVRFTPEEIAHIKAVAKARNVTTPAFVRQAALSEAERGDEVVGAQEAVLEKLLRQAEDLNKTVSRLQAYLKEPGASEKPRIGIGAGHCGDHLLSGNAVKNRGSIQTS